MPHKQVGHYRDSQVCSALSQHLFQAETTRVRLVIAAQESTKAKTGKRLQQTG
jgi:hypothetical protein